MGQSPSNDAKFIYLPSFVSLSPLNLSAQVLSLPPMIIVLINWVILSQPKPKEKKKRLSKSIIYLLIINPNQPL